jgi:hypothetical protein
LANEVVVVRIQGKSLTFANSSTNYQDFVPLEQLRLSKDGILKEHPDLKDHTYPMMCAEAIRRLKVLLWGLDSEDKIKDYVIKELNKFGYKLYKIEKRGFRPEVYRI